MTSSSSTTWQVRVPVELAEALLADMVLVGAKDKSDLMRIALERLRRETEERKMADDIRRFYGGQRAPVDELTAALYGAEE